MFYEYLILFVILRSCDAYKVLVIFPLPWKSHSILGESYVRHLLEAGHDVTYLTPIPIQNPQKGLRQIDVSANREFFNTGDYDLQSLIKKKGVFQNHAQRIKSAHYFYSHTFKLDIVQKFIDDPKEQFDVVVAEWLHTETGAGFAALFGCPLIWSSSIDPHTFVLSLIDEHLNPSFNMFYFYKDPSLTFWSRANQLWTLFHNTIYMWTRQNEDNENFKNIFGKGILKRGREIPNFEDVRYNASLMLGNSDITTGHAISLPQNFIHIGGYHIKDVIEPLPEDLKVIMDRSTNGVIYFSLGSSLESSRIPTEIKQRLLKVFGELNQTVILKMNNVQDSLPKNVHSVSWVPQQSILAHPNCNIFITHGGQLSIIETLNFGVPIIGIPFFGDQHLNVNKAVAKGFAKRIDFNNDTPEILKDTIQEMMKNTSYRTRAKYLSSLFGDAMSPGQRLVHAVELVARTQGAPHLRSVALHVPLYEKLYLDLLLFVIVVSFIFVLAIKHLYVLAICNKTSKNKIS